MVCLCCKNNDVTSKSKHIPIYSLEAFHKADGFSGGEFQVEVFDANRHFQVQYPHSHDFFEVLFLTGGAGYHVIDSNRYTINPPCIFFMSPGQAHKLELSNDIAGYIFLFTADFYLINQTNHNRLIEFPFFFTLQQNNPPLLLENEADVAFLKSLFLRGMAAPESTKELGADVVRSLLELILTTCASLYVNENQVMTKGKGHVLVKRFFQLVEENYQRNLSINQYAEKLVVTPNHLTQTVRELTGKTSTQIVRDKQVIEAKRLLVHSSMGISEISHHLNFSDQSYFTKFFKKNTGFTPKSYRVKSMKST